MIRINKGISVKEVEADQLKDIKTTKTPTMVAIMKGEPIMIGKTMMIGETIMISEVDQMNNQTINLVIKLILKESK